MRALVAMSGGVDSSVAAALMLEDGYDVVGVTMKQWEGADGAMPYGGCCTVADAEDARRVAAQLGIPYYVLDYVEPFTREVVDRFAEEYLAGRTPNPCLECNRRVRFSALLDRTEQLGCDVMVTGHHARIRYDGRWRLLRATDPGKDQSYVLHMLGQAQLAKIRLPIGEMTKSEVREKAARLGLRSAAKPDSQDLCFVGREGYRAFLRSRVPAAAAPGEIVDLDGEVIGSHNGTADFTIGQRKGLGVASAERRYVIDLDAASRRVVVGNKEDLLVDGCELEDVRFVSGRVPVRRRLAVKVRYRSAAVPATLSRNGSWHLVFAEPVAAVAPGQAAVLYDGEEVVGGGTIVASVSSRTSGFVVGGR